MVRTRPGDVAFIGLGTVWIPDGLEVAIIGSIGDRLTLGGIIEIFFGVSAGGKELEDIAKPLTAEG